MTIGLFTPISPLISWLTPFVTFSMERVAHGGVGYSVAFLRTALLSRTYITLLRESSADRSACAGSRTNNLKLDFALVDFTVWPWYFSHNISSS